MKKCFKCGDEKSLSDFYRHLKMTDGVLGKCKDCTKRDVKSRYKEKVLDSNWVEKERERGRSKYQKFRYKSRPDTKIRSMVNYAEKYPEKIAAKSKCGRTPYGANFHHWSYAPEYQKDVIILTVKEHSTLHRFIQYVQEMKIYKTLAGELLDTREKHEAFIRQIFQPEAG